MVDKVEFEFPDEKETKAEATEEKNVVKAEESDIEVIDDTPEQDRGRKPLDRPVADPSDDELQEYSDKVRNRIKELTHARHDERRAKEALAREKEEAFRIAQAVYEENRQLKERINKGETSFVSQAQRLAEVEVEKAKAALKAAHEAGDTEAFAEAQVALNKAVFMQERVKAFKPAPLQNAEPSANVQPQQAAQPPIRQVQVDAKADAWRQQNPWFGQDDEMTSFALGLHNKLVKAGYDTQSQDYYDAIDNRMKQVFPDQFKPAEKSEATGKRPATVVAPSSRSTSAKKIKLTQTQVQIAKRLGVPLEVYARKVAELEQQNG